jgi:hypothetical protein
MDTGSLIRRRYTKTTLLAGKLLQPGMGAVEQHKNVGIQLSQLFLIIHRHVPKRLV